MEMPVEENVCPICWHRSGAADTYCSSCGTVLDRGDSTLPAGQAAAETDVAPLVLSPPAASPGLQPLHIVPDISRQRRRLMRRGFALLMTLAIASIFLLSLVPALDGQREAQALAGVSGLLCIVALGGWINLGIKRSRKRSRRQEWRATTS